MATNFDVYVEVGSKRAFATSLEWPGWSRPGRGEEEALEALVTYGERYSKAIGRAAGGFKPPADVSRLRVVERLKGDATTDFGAPSMAASSDDRPLKPAEIERLAELLRACWSAFDRAVKRFIGAELRKGPRGGGRNLDAIVEHVLDADAAYLRPLGGNFKRSKDGDVAEDMKAMRREFVESFNARARGEPPDLKRPRKLWLPRYAVRRSAWHALDHAWEIEDRAV